MHSAPAQFTEEERRANAAFDALLWAMSRPGSPRRLPAAGEAVLIDALLDRECKVYSADPLLVPQIMRVGAEITDMAQADHVFLGALTSADVLKTIRLGRDLYPDEGATLVLRVRLGEGTTIRLTGPGVNGETVLQLAGVPEGFWAMRRSVMRYPMGFELILLDGDQLVGLPRSTHVEVL